MIKSNENKEMAFPFRRLSHPNSHIPTFQEQLIPFLSAMRLDRNNE